MKSKTFFSTLSASLMIGALLATFPAISADNKPSIRDPLEFERASPREQLTVADRKQLEPLWKVYCERSTELKRVSESLVKSGWTNERINEFFDSVFNEHIVRVSTVSPSKFGISLTVPSLEPTYPVPGGQGPAYLLPAKAKNEGRRGYSKSASFGDGAASLLWRETDGRIKRALDNLCLIYQGYKSRCAVLEKLEKEMRDVLDENSTKLQRQRMLTTDRDNLRKQLVELVGEDAVKKLDEVLGFEKQSQ